MSEHNEHEKQPIIIKKVIKKKHGGHHGGSWKIAYADFMTAMMAFFLLMWLLSLLNKYQLQGVAEYFQKPLKEVFTQQTDRINETQENKVGPASDQKTTGIEKPPKEKPVEDQKKKDVDKEKEREREKEREKEKEKEKKLKEQQMKQLNNMRQELVEKLERDADMAEFKNQLNFVVTEDGLKIEIKELEGKPMFSNGKADFQKYAKEILQWLGNQVKNYPNRLMVIGHTDSVPFINQNPNYGNWELSADRANATRRIIQTLPGMSENKVIRVVGVADTDRLEQKNGLDAANRRIEIIVLTKDKANALLEDVQ